jgi:transposase
MLLGVLFYAYSQGIFSSRKIAQLVRKHICFMYLAGMQTPDFRTIADFRKKHLELIKDYFRQILLLCRKAGLLPLRTVAIDGSKVAASASNRRTMSRSELAQLLAATEAEIEQLLQTAEAVDEAENQNCPSDANPVALQVKNLQEIRQRLLQAKEQLHLEKQQKQVNLTDPDCRVQQGVGAGYNCQIAVDVDNQFIVGTQVVSQPNDRNQLMPMIVQVESSTGSEGEAKNVLADCGYASASAFCQLSNMPHINAYVPTQEQVHRQRHQVSAFDKSQFQYDLESQTCVCPQGHPLRVLRRGVNKSGQPYINFRGSACPSCPVHLQCTKAKYRNLVLLLAEPLIAQMQEKMNSPGGKQAMKLRKQSAEPVYGILKEQMGFRRFHLRGLAKVNGEFALLCIAFNLKKLSILLNRRNLGQVLAVAKRQIDAIFLFLSEKGLFALIYGRQNQTALGISAL